MSGGLLTAIDDDGGGYYDGSTLVNLAFKVQILLSIPCRFKRLVVLQVLDVYIHYINVT